MKLLSLLILCITYFNPGSWYADGINYKPRMLTSELEDISGGRGFQINEIKPPATSANNNVLTGKFFIAECDSNTDFTVYIGRVHSCRSGGCSDQSVADIDFNYEFFDYFIIFDTKKRIKSVRVFNYDATHGQEITVRRWLDQFIGYDGNKSLRVGKEIDSISGATISVNGLVADIQQKTTILKNMEF